jgi:hypothetical protein
MIAPAYVAYTVLGGNLAILAPLLFGLRQALACSGWPVEERASASRKTSLGPAGDPFHAERGPDRRGAGGNY